MLVALLSWWIAPLLPLPRSGLSCAPDCCPVAAGMHAEGYSVWQELEFDQRVSSQELSLVELDAYQVVYACLIEASRRISLLQ